MKSTVPIWLIRLLSTLLLFASYTTRAQEGHLMFYVTRPSAEGIQSFQDELEGLGQDANQEPLFTSVIDLNRQLKSEALVESLNTIFQQRLNSPVPLIDDATQRVLEEIVEAQIPQLQYFLLIEINPLQNSSKYEYQFYLYDVSIHESIERSQLQEIILSVLSGEYQARTAVTLAPGDAIAAQKEVTYAINKLFPDYNQPPQVSFVTQKKVLHDCFPSPCHITVSSEKPLQISSRVQDEDNPPRDITLQWFWEDYFLPRAENGYFESEPIGKDSVFTLRLKADDGVSIARNYKIEVRVVAPPPPPEFFTDQSLTYISEYHRWTVPSYALKAPLPYHVGELYVPKFQLTTVQDNLPVYYLNLDTLATPVSEEAFRNGAARLTLHNQYQNHLDFQQPLPDRALFVYWTRNPLVEYDSIPYVRWYCMPRNLRPGWDYRLSLIPNLEGIYYQPYPRKMKLTHTQSVLGVRFSGWSGTLPQYLSDTLGRVEYRTFKAAVSYSRRVLNLGRHVPLYVGGAFNYLPTGYRDPDLIRHFPVIPSVFIRLDNPWIIGHKVRFQQQVEVYYQHTLIQGTVEPAVLAELNVGVYRLLSNSMEMGLFFGWFCGGTYADDSDKMGFQFGLDVNSLVPNVLKE